MRCSAELVFNPLSEHFNLQCIDHGLNEQLQEYVHGLG